MGGTVDKFMNFMKMNNDDDEDEGYLDSDEFDEDEYDEPPVKHSGIKEDAGNAASEEKPKRLVKSQPFRGNGSRKGGNMSSSNMEVCLCKPVSFDDAPQIADALLAGRSVVLNLEGLDANLANRIFDFATGACYALKGRCQSVSKHVYVITPESVYITGDMQDDAVAAVQGFPFS